SGRGGWNGSTGRSKVLPGRVLASCSTRSNGMTDGEQKLTPGDGRPGGAAQADGSGGRDLPEAVQRSELPRRAVLARGDDLLARGDDPPDPPEGGSPQAPPSLLPPSLALSRSSVQAAPRPSESPISANP